MLTLLLQTAGVIASHLSHRRGLDDDEGDNEGCAIAIILEGMRAIAVDVQCSSSKLSRYKNARCTNSNDL